LAIADYPAVVGRLKKWRGNFLPCQSAILNASHLPERREFQTGGVGAFDLAARFGPSQTPESRIWDPQIPIATPQTLEDDIPASIPV
jgi:hypothetical protein